MHWWATGYRGWLAFVGLGAPHGAGGTKVSAEPGTAHDRSSPRSGHLGVQAGPGGSRIPIFGAADSGSQRAGCLRIFITANSAYVIPGPAGMVLMGIVAG